MVTRVPDIKDTDLFTIGETASLLGVHRNTLRRYTKDRKIDAEIREADGKALYRGRDIKRLVTTTI